MSTLALNLEDDLLALLRQANRPLDATVREMLILELYRRGALSSGRAAELAGMTRLHFIEHASRLGIPFLDMTNEEWAAERSLSDRV